MKRDSPSLVTVLRARAKPARGYKSLPGAAAHHPTGRRSGCFRAERSHWFVTRRPKPSESVTVSNRANVGAHATWGVANASSAARRPCQLACQQSNQHPGHGARGDWPSRRVCTRSTLQLQPPAPHRSDGPDVPRSQAVGPETHLLQNPPHHPSGQTPGLLGRPEVWPRSLRRWVPVLRPSHARLTGAASHRAGCPDAQSPALTGYSRVKLAGATLPSNPTSSSALLYYRL